MASPTISIARVDEAQMQHLIASANRSLIYMAPGVSQGVAAAIEERWRALGALNVRVVLDVDPEVVRLGYGIVEALEKLQSVANELGTVIYKQPGLRIGLVIADHSTLVFAPTPLLIEAGSSQPYHPNSIALDYVPPSVVRELGLGPKGIAEQTIGRESVSAQTIQLVTQSLKRNPPLKFDVARTMQVFNAHFEFVEFEMKGAYLSRRTVPIPADLMGMARAGRAQHLLRSSFRLIDKDGPVSSVSIEKLKNYIIKRYLVPLPGYGTVILRVNKEDFKTAISSLEKYVKRFQKRTQGLLQKEIETNRTALVEALLPAVRKNPPDRWLRHLGSHPEEQVIRKMLDDDLRRAFDQAQKILSQVQPKVLFKGVTYEMLNDAKFVEVAKSHLPTLRELHQEFWAAPEEKKP